MKIGILTHPLGRNYGGLLQAYALLTTLKHLGHEPWIISRVITDGRLRRVAACVKHGLARLIGAEITVDDSALNEFRDNIKPRTKAAKSTFALKKQALKHDFDCYIVGSDQVWRPRYVRNITNYFFDFLSDKGPKRISYAASFGVDNWEFSKGQTVSCRDLIKNFDAVSVREHSGIGLCKKYFGIDAQQVCDPVFLINADSWREIAEIKPDRPRVPKALIYVFEENDLVSQMQSYIEECLGLSVNRFKPEMSVRGMRKYMHLKPVNEWLRAIATSQLVITDSFHVCAFCIIFNTPFRVIENNVRGNTRIDSLLDTFNLSHCRISSMPDSTDDFIPALDSPFINSTICNVRKKSMDFLKNSLV